MYVELDEAKKHLQIDEDFKGDDSYISGLIECSETVISNHLFLKSLQDQFGEDLPRPVKHAILLFVGHLYANREPVAFAQSYPVPMSINYLLSTYVNYRDESGVTY